MKVHMKKNGRVWEFKYSNHLRRLAYETPKNTYALFVEVNNITDEIDIMLGRQPKEHTEYDLTGWWDKTEIIENIELPNGSVQFFTKRRKL